MRTPFIFSAVALMAMACGDATQSPLAPSVSPGPQADLSDVVALRIAVDDGFQRLLPGISPDAAGPIGDALRVLDASLKDAASSSSTLAAALAGTDQTLRRFAGADRPDRATLDALQLELSVTTRQ